MVKFLYAESSLISDLFFVWCFSTIKKYSLMLKSLSFSDIFEIPESISINSSLSILKRNWEQEEKKPKPKFLKAMMKTIYKEYFSSVLCIFIAQSFAVIQALFIYFIIKYIRNYEKPFYEGFLPIFFFSLSIIVTCCFRNYAGYRVLILTGKIKDMVWVLVTEKVLKLNTCVISEENTKGKIINVLTTDMELLELLTFTIFFWCLPTTIVISCLILNYTFGSAGIIGIGISAGHIPIVVIFGALMARFKKKGNLLSDVRVKMIEEMIEGIRIIKLYAWEKAFLNKIFKKREEEVQKQRIAVNLNSILQLLGLSGISLIVYATLCLQVSNNNALDSAEVFVLISIFFTVHLVTAYISIVGINTIFIFIGVMKRIGEILQLKEMNDQILPSQDKYSVCLSQATFAWKEEVLEEVHLETEMLEVKKSRNNSMVCLREISFFAYPHELIMVVGGVGSGKSSLLLGILGELFITSGAVLVQGSLAYVPEEPWVVSGTIRENILMGKAFIPDLYDYTLHTCCLLQDLDAFPDSDQTLVGDRGLTLSGGQRARINLARAVYANTDILLLDDPLSAVDSSVANFIFAECIQKQLREKTVILVTHQMQFLKQADKILVIDASGSKFFGTYEQLCMKNQNDLVLGQIELQNENYGQRIEGKEILQKEERKNFREIFEESDGGVKKITYLRYLMLGFKSLIFLMFVVVFMILSQVVYQFVLYWAAYWSKQSDQKDPFYSSTLGYLVLVCYGTVFIRIFIMVNLMLVSNINLHNNALKSVSLASSAFFDNNSFGKIINRFSKDIGVVDGPLQYFLFDSVSVTLGLLGYLTINVIVVPYNLIIMAMWVVFLYFLLQKVTPLVMKFRTIEILSRAPLLSTLNSMINGLPVIRSLKLQAKFVSDLENYANSHYASYLTFHTMMRFNQFYSDLGCAVIAVVNTIIIVSLKGVIDPDLAAFSLSCSLAFVNIASVWSKSVLELGSNMSAAQRLLEYTDVPCEGTLELNDSPQITNGDIRFENVSVKYQPSLPLVLNGLTFSIKSGHKIGIVGRTGAGKSSILQVLLRLVTPHSGTIFIGGIDYLSMGLHQLRQQISVIPQSALIFSASVLENLDPFGLYTETDIFNALECVDLKDLILEYGEGLALQVNGDGINFSAGQKQLLCLARVILKKNKIIVMDEATANIDNETDTIMQQVINQEFFQATRIIIAHRIRTIIESDKIIVMETGKCQEFGTPKELYEQPESLFRQIVKNTGKIESKFLLKKINNRIV